MNKILNIAPFFLLCSIALAESAPNFKSGVYGGFGLGIEALKTQRTDQLVNAAGVHTALAENKKVSAQKPNFEGVLGYIHVLKSIMVASEIAVCYAHIHDSVVKDDATS